MEQWQCLLVRPLDWALRAAPGSTLICQPLVAGCCPEHLVSQSENLLAYQPVAPWSMGVRAFYRQGPFLATRCTLEEHQVSSLALALTLLLQWIQTAAEG